jgi:PPM family protein phosphatase
VIDNELDIAAISDAGTERDDNEDCCGSFAEDPACAIVAIADGVSSCAGGEVASQMAIEVVIRAHREGPPTMPAGQRLYRAVQQANIAIHDRSIAVPELRGMATTLTAVALERGELTAIHIGDSRLYLVRGHVIEQLTKDHTVAAEKVRFGLMSKERARTHVDHCTLVRSVGRELIVSRDRITRRLVQGDVLILCTDGLYNVLADEEMARLVADRDSATACRNLIAAANARGTFDNATAAVVRLIGATPADDGPNGFVAALRRLVRGFGR